MISISAAAAIAGLVGFAVMSVELTAVRLLAPHFGDSAYVWTNVIGVMLAAMAVGAWLGGRAADSAAARGPGRVLLIAGAVTGLAALVAHPLGDSLLPDGLALDAAMGALVRGSLTATLLLFGPPILLAGMATPMLVVALAADGRGVGKASGHVATWSTLGSLVGTFATTHLLIPGIGSQITVVVCALGLIVAGLLAGGLKPAAVAAAAVLPLTALLLGPRPLHSAGQVVLAEVESAYQYLAVVEGEEAGRRSVQLQINEGLDSFHSVALEGTAFTGGRYYDSYAALPFVIGDGALPQRFDVLSIGAAAGTFERLLAQVVGDAARFDSVELDPAVVSLAEAHFGGFPDTATVYAGIDGRVFVERSQSSYDAIIVDAYERQIYIPAQLASVEFFEAARERLTDGGVIALNVGGRTFADPVVEVTAATLASVFGSAQIYRVPRSRNFMVCARRGAEQIDPAVLRRALDGGLAASEASADRDLAAVLDKVSQASAWRLVSSDATGATALLHDDRPFLDRVQDQALRRSIETEVLSLSGGSVEPGVAAQGAYQALQTDDVDGALAALASSREPNATLRFYAGDARWLNHDVTGARAEYLRAKELGMDEGYREALAARLRDTEAEIAKLELADDVRSRSGLMAWLAAGLVLLLIPFLVARAGGRLA